MIGFHVLHTTVNDFQGGGYKTSKYRIQYITFVLHQNSEHFDSNLTKNHHFSKQAEKKLEISLILHIKGYSGYDSPAFSKTLLISKCNSNT